MPGNHYEERVNRVLDYIASHLEGDLSLTRLSEVGCFSRFHFHRIFQGITHETLNAHVRRVRLERAALLLRASPRKRITDVAIETGFAGTAEFSRAFKSHFHCTASSWDRRSPLENSKICKEPESRPFHTIEELERWKAASDVPVRVQQFAAFRYVYCRHFGPHESSTLVDRYHAMLAWLAKRGTAVRDIVVVGMSQDDPAITPADKYRYDLGIAFQGGALPQQAECDAEGFSIRDFEPMQIAALHCVGDIGHVDRAWHYLYRIWLPESAWEPNDLPAMEMFVRLPEEIGWTTFDLKACIPVVRR